MQVWFLFLFGVDVTKTTIVESLIRQCRSLNTETDVSFRSRTQCAVYLKLYNRQVVFYDQYLQYGSPERIFKSLFFGYQQLYPSSRSFDSHTHKHITASIKLAYLASHAIKSPVLPTNLSPSSSVRL